MNKLMLVSEFLNKSGMRKVGTGLSIYLINAILLSQAMLPAPEFKELSKWLILALFAGNALEHYVKAQSKKESPDAQTP